MNAALQEILSVVAEITVAEMLAAPDQKQAKKKTPCKRTTKRKSDKSQ